MNAKKYLLVLLGKKRKLDKYNHIDDRYYPAINYSKDKLQATYVGRRTN